MLNFLKRLEMKLKERSDKKMENPIEQKYPMTYAILRNAADRISNWKNVTPMAKIRKEIEINNVVIALVRTL